MGRTKSFFDKTNSVTYSLIHTSAPAGEQSQRLWVEKNRGVGIGRPDSEEASEAGVPAGKEHPGGLPLSSIQSQPAADLTEQDRTEIVDLGLPDDGYNYLQHLRDSAATESLHREQPSSSLLEGSAVFVPSQPAEAPPEDLKIFQSFRLQLSQPALDEAEAAEALPGVSAFSREAGIIWNKHEDELAELRKVMLSAEGAEDSADSADELTDDFLLTATQDTSEHQAAVSRLVHDGAAEQPPAMCTAASNAAWEEGTSDSEDSSEFAAHASALRPPARSAGPGSIASTYWRPERADRNEHLSAIDERFEQLALGYNSEEFGDLGSSDEEGDDRPAGHDVNQYGSILDDFLAVHATHDHAHEGGQPYSVPAEQARSMTAEELEAAVAVAKAREYVRLAEQRPEPAADRDAAAWEHETPREQWDCESVLTSLSNLDNHPGRILEPGALRRPRRSLQQQEQRIHLSAKSGLPVRPARAVAGVQPPQQAQHRRGETAEQKRERKAASKEARRRARASKKELKVMFKDEAKRHQQAGAAASTIPMP